MTGERHPEDVGHNDAEDVGRGHVTRRQMPLGASH